MNWFKKKKKTNPEPEDNSQKGPDFSTVNSLEKAIELYNKQKLGKIYLMPLEFGGQEIPMNTLYVPKFVCEFKANYDLMIEKLLREGKKMSYSATPEYKGESFIPSKLVISVKGDADFTETIEIW